MAFRHLLMLATMTALALSGCAGQTAPGPAPGTDPSALDDAGEGAGQAEGSTAAQPILVSQAFAHDGTTALGGCVYAVVAYPCSFPMSDNAFVVDVEGTASRVQATMTWEPRAGYELGLFVGLPDGDGWSFAPSRWVGGSEGLLTIDVDVSGHDAGKVLVGANSWTGQGVAGAGGGASIPFDFHVDGFAESLVVS